MLVRTQFFPQSEVCSRGDSIDVDHDPSKVARAERKARVAKNERQTAQNVARAQAEGAVAGPSREQRKNEINRTLATSRVSTASMGRFDKVLEGEKKSRGVKRKVCSLLFFIIYRRLTHVYSLNPQRRLLSGKRQRILLSYRRWKGSRARKRPRKTQETMFSMYAKPSVLPAEERVVLHWPNLLGEARQKANQGGNLHILTRSIHRRTHVSLLCGSVRQA